MASLYEIKLKVRRAKRSDRDSILRFCTNTFSWGDYIDRVFDNWYREPNGKLFVAVKGNRNNHLPSNREKASIHINNSSARGEPIALSHAVLGPDKAHLWIEGIRVDSNNRRQKVATTLMDKMLQYGKRQGAIEASAIISANNQASKSLFNSMGFSIISKWRYYNIDLCSKHKSIYGEFNTKDKGKKRIAALDNVADLWRYLKYSRTYRLSGKRYFNDWRWYPLDYKTILDLATHSKVLLIEDKSSIEGVAIINPNRHNSNADVFQIAYLDASSASKLKDLVLYCADAALASFQVNCNRGCNQQRLELASYQSKGLSKVMCSFRIIESAQFYLYSISLNS